MHRTALQIMYDPVTQFPEANSKKNLSISNDVDKH